MSRRLDNIQYFRGLAALSVVIGHIANQYLQWNSFAEIPLISGRFGVDVFFVISGVIMYHTSLAGTPPRLSAMTFARKRIARIVPLYWLATAAELALRHLEKNPTTLWAVVASLMFFPTGENPVLGVGWTLNFEMFFYALIFIALALNAKRALAAVLLILMTVPFAHPFLHGAPGFIRTWTDPSLFEFALGILIGMAWQRWPTRLPAPALAFAASCLAVGLIADNWHFQRIPLPIHILGGATIVGLAMFTANQAPVGLLKPIEALGDASYSLYLTHVLTLGFMKQLVIAFDLPVWTWAVAGLPISICFGWLCHQYVEQPLLKVFGGRSNNRTPVPSTP